MVLFSLCHFTILLISLCFYLGDSFCFIDTPFTAKLSWSVFFLASAQSFSYFLSEFLVYFSHIKKYAPLSFMPLVSHWWTPVRRVGAPDDHEAKLATLWLLFLWQTKTFLLISVLANPISGLNFLCCIWIFLEST